VAAPKQGSAKPQPSKPTGKPEDKRPVVFSTDPEPTHAPVAPPLPANPAAPLRTRQQNIPVLVALERKGRGGKSVSVIKQVMSPPAGKRALLKLLKTRLGTGGTLKDEEIELQGDHRDAIVALLKELGYQAKRAGG
jgi:translation initiation factor 1